MANSLLANLSPVYGALKGEGMFGDVLGKKSENEAEAQKAMQAAQEKKAADEQALAKANAQEWAKRQNGMKKGGMAKSSSASRRADGMASKGKTRGKFC
jgi:hypothetical protein